MTDFPQLPPPSWKPRQETSFYAGMSANVRAANDPLVQQLFVTYQDKSRSEENREAALSALRGYLWQEYQVTWDRVFNWQAFRESYAI